MRQSDGTNTLDFQYDANGIAAGFNYNDTPYFYMRNLQGDVVAITDADGTLVAEYTYDAWGNVTAFSGAMATINPIRYRGYYQDPVTGWYFLQSRYYNPDWRRFLNSDALFVAGDAISGSNMYAYCNGTPVMFADSNGMKPVSLLVRLAQKLGEKSPKLYNLGEGYNQAAGKVSQKVSAPIGHVMGPVAEVGAPIVGDYVMEPIATNFDKPWDQREYPLKDLPLVGGIHLRTIFSQDLDRYAWFGGLTLDFHKNRNIFSKNYGNYTTLEGSYQWQKQVGYTWWYDWCFNAGGPVDKVRYQFVVDQGTPNATYYIIWCWKGEYWNLGAGAEIGIYYNEDADQAEQGYYKIEPEKLFVTVLMNVFYGTEQISAKRTGG